MKVQVFHYQILEEASLEELVKFKEHRRLKVFYHKGTKCVTCEKIGTKLIKGRDNKGNEHWDVYTEDLFPLTVDHILPKSLGGLNNLNNLQPMCTSCNNSKGNGAIRHKKENIPKLIPVSISNLTENELIGKVIWKRRKGKMRPLGKVHSITTNPHTNLPTATIVDNNNSFYDLRTLYLAA